MKCSATDAVNVDTGPGTAWENDVLLLHGKPLGYDLLLGINAIKALGGISVGPTGSVQIGEVLNVQPFPPVPLTPPKLPTN